MLPYVLICISLSLAGVAGLQFVYLHYLDRVDKERKKHVYDLELRCKHLAKQLAEAEQTIAEQEKVLGSFEVKATHEEMWADVIDDR